MDSMGIITLTVCLLILVAYLIFDYYMFNIFTKEKVEYYTCECGKKEREDNHHSVLSDDEFYSVCEDCYNEAVKETTIKN